MPPKSDHYSAERIELLAIAHELVELIGQQNRWAVHIPQAIAALRIYAGYKAPRSPRKVAALASIDQRREAVGDVEEALEGA